MRHQPLLNQVHQAAVTRQFSPMVEAVVKRYNDSPYLLRKANWDRIGPIFELARETVALTDAAIIKQVLTHNPDCGRLIFDSRTKEDFGIFAYLPLNSRGAMAIVSGGFNGASPDPKMLCRAGERPIAIYVWLTFALDGKFIPALPAMFGCLEELAPDGCTIFSRAAHDYSARLWDHMGMFAAKDRYPGAPEWLIMTEPAESDLNQPREPGSPIEVRCVRTIDEFMQVAAVRSAVYIAEQLCRYDEEYDGNDFCGTQFLGLVDGDAAGCARIRYFGEFAKLERIAVRPQYRQSELAFELMRHSIEHCRRKGFRTLYGHARRDLVPLYERFGCRVIEDRQAFTFANVEYREMLLDLAPHKDPITLDCDPMVIVRQEGHWENLGPLELSIAAGTEESAQAVADKMKTINVR